MDDDYVGELFEETVSLALEADGALDSGETFASFVREYLPDDILETLRELTCGDNDGDQDAFLLDVYEERFKEEEEEEEDPAFGIKASTCCEICEREVKLTRHHVYPREEHKRLMKRKGMAKKLLSTTIGICSMCHQTVHRFFSNEELADSYFSVDLLLDNAKFYKYAAWASKQPNTKRKRVRG